MSSSQVNSAFSAVSTLLGRWRHPVKTMMAVALWLTCCLATAAPTAPVITATSIVTSGKTGLIASTPAQTGVTFTWSFAPTTGGTITAGQGTASMTYTAGAVGTYTLTCVAKDASNNTNSGTKSIQVVAAPAAPVITLGDTKVNTLTTNVMETALTTLHTASVPVAPAGITYAWTITNGTITAGAATNAVTYTAGGTVGTAALKLTCTATNAAATAVATTKNIDIFAVPATAITVAKGATTLTGVTVGAAGLTATVPAGLTTPAPGTTYAWVLTGGTVTAGAGTNQVTFTVSGAAGSTLKIDCTVTNPVGTAVLGTKSLLVAAKPSTVITTAADVAYDSTGAVTHAASVPTAPTGSVYAWTVSALPTATVTLSATNVASITYKTAAAAGTVITLNCAITSADGVASAATPKTVKVDALPAAPVITLGDTKVNTLTTNVMETALTTLHTASVPTAPTGITYAWTITNGTITAGAATNAVTYTAGGTVGTAALKLTCTAKNAAGTAAATTKNIDIFAAPATTITVAKGATTLTGVTVGATGITATVPVGPTTPTPGTTYAWVVTGGTVTAGAGTNQITFTVTGLAASTLKIDCTVTNPVGTAVLGTKSLLVVAKPSTVVTTAADVAYDSTGAVTHAASVPTAPTGSVYAWTASALPTATVTLSATNVASITYKTAAVAGTVITLNCAITSPDGVASAATPKTVTVDPLPAAPVITLGDTKVNTLTTNVMETAGTTLHTATVPAASTGITYAWTITNGTITAGAATNAVTYTAGTTVGTAALKLTCTAKNAAGTAAATTKNIDIFAAPATTITVAKGATTLTGVTVGATGLTATVPVGPTTPAPGTTYAWVVTGGTVTAGAGTNQITFTVTGLAASTLKIDCTVTNPVGTVAAGTKSLTVAAKPSTVITTAADVAYDSTGAVTHAASVPAAPTGSVYAWTVSALPTATVTLSATNVASITYKTAAAVGTVITLNCAITSPDGVASAATPKTVTVDPLPTAPVITLGDTKVNTLTTNVMETALTTLHTASVPTAPTGITYAWTITNGTITAGAATNAVTYTAGGTVGTAALKLTCTAKNAAATAAATTKNVDIFAAPATTITVAKGATTLTSVTVGATGLTATVPVGPTTPTPGTTYAWVVTGGTVTAGAGTNQITFTVTGAAASTLKIDCTVTNPVGTVAAGTKSLTVAAKPSTVITTAADVTVDGTGAVTHAASVPTAPTGSVYAWTASALPTATVTLSATNAASITYKTAAAAGTVITLNCAITTADGIGSVATPKTVTVDSAPTLLTITPPAGNVVTGSLGNTASVNPTGTTGLTFNWATSTGVTITAGGTTSTATFTAGATGTATLKCAISNKAGATAVTPTASVKILPNSTITAATPVTSGLNLTATVPVDANCNFLWTIVNQTGGAAATIVSGATTNSLTYNTGPNPTGASGTFTLQCVKTAKLDATNTSTGTKVITVYPQPVAALTANPLTLAGGGTSVLTPVFSGGTGVINQNVGTVTTGVGKSVSPAVTTTYTLTVTNGATTTASASATVTVNPGFYAGPSMNSVRTHHSATELTDGKVLIAFGLDASTKTNKADIYDPAANTFTAVNITNAVARSLHTAVRLSDGNVLVAGGIDATSAMVTTGQRLLTGATPSWTSSTPMIVPRRSATSTLLPDGRVLIVGGINGSTYLASVEAFTAPDYLFHAVAGSPVLTTARAGHTATLLPNGKVLIAGGETAAAVYTAKAQVYNPSTDTFETELTIKDGSSVDVPLGQHTATLRADGKVLLYSGTKIVTYDPTAGTFTVGINWPVRNLHTATYLPDGKTLLAGGNDSAATPAPLATADLLTLVSGTTNTYTPTASLSAARAEHQAILLKNGKVLVCGGKVAGVNTATTEIFNTAEAAPGTQTLLLVADKTTVASGTTVNILPVFIGGTGTVSGYGAVTSGKPFQVAPTTTTIYTLTVGTQTKTITITVG